MVQGYERREQGQDPNAPKAKEVDTVSMGTVMAPRNSSMSGVGSELEELASAFGSLRGPLEDYFKKKEGQAKIQGAMMYAQGKAESEVMEAGGSNAVTGYLNLQAKTAANQWANAKEMEIAQSAHTMSPDEFQKYLQGDLSTLMKSMSGADEATQAFVVNNATENFTKLIDTHVKANAKYVKEQTATSSYGLFRSEMQRFPKDAKPEEVDSALHGANNILLFSGLTKEEQLQVKTQAAKDELDNGNEIGAQYLQRSGSIPNTEYSGGSINPELAAKNRNIDPQWVSAVVLAESGNSAYDPKTGGILTSPSGAIGVMQTLPSTLKNPGYGVKPAKDNSPEEAARVGLDYLAAMHKRYGNKVIASMAYNAGPGFVDSHLKTFGDPRTDPNVTIEAFVGSFRNPVEGNSKRDPEETKKYIDKINKSMSEPTDSKFALNKGATLASMISQGYTREQIVTMERSIDKNNAEKSRAFSEERENFQNATIEQTMQDGNFDAGMRRIIEMADKNQYTDAWKEEMVNKTRLAVEKYEKVTENKNSVLQATATGTLSTLSKKDQDLGVALQSAKDIQEVQNLVQAGSLPEGQVAHEILKRRVQFATKQSIVDDKLKASIQSGLSTILTESAGTVSKEAVDAVQLYTSIKGSIPPEAAEQYAGDNKDLLDMAEYFTGVDGNIKSAITMAKGYSDDLKRGVIKPKSIDPGKVKEAVSKYAESVDSWYLPLEGMFSTKTATGAAQVLDEEIESFKNDPHLEAFVRNTAKMELLRVPEDLAYARAREQALSRVELVGGQAIVAPQGTTIGGLAGLPPGTPKNAVHLGVLKVLDRELSREDSNKSHPGWLQAKEFQAFRAKGAGEGELGYSAGKLAKEVGTVLTAGTLLPFSDTARTSIAEKFRGVPLFQAQYDHESRSMIVRPVKNNDQGLGTVVIDDPIVIKLEDAGTEYKNSVTPEKYTSALSYWSDNIKQSIAAGEEQTLGRTIVNEVGASMRHKKDVTVQVAKDIHGALTGRR